MPDPTIAPRPGEELDIVALGAYLRSALPGFDTPLEILQFPSGHSNLTYLLRAGGREIVLRRPPFGRKPKSGHDMHREWKILSALQDVFPYSPKPLAYCEDTAILGAPFYVMERIRGLILRRDPPPGVSPAQMRRICENLIAVHKELHRLDYRKIGLDGLGKPRGYVARQVSGWISRYRNALTPNAPDFADVISWLQAHLPQERGAALIHNDYRFDNVVFAPEDFRVVGVLDWEMATVGDPLMDLGASLAYWIQADDPAEMQSIKLGPTDVPGALTRREVVRHYLGEREIPESEFVFYYVYGLFRLAGIAQQIYWRFYHGQTRDQRFRRFDRYVAILERAARRVIAEGTIA